MATTFHEAQTSPRLACCAQTNQLAWKLLVLIVRCVSLSFLQGAIGLIFWAFVCRQRSIVDPSKKRRDVLHWGLCVPASCDNSDVEAHLRAMISPLGASMGLEGSISVEACQSAHQHRPPLSAAALALMWVVSAWVHTPINMMWYLQPGHPNLTDQKF